MNFPCYGKIEQQFSGYLDTKIDLPEHGGELECENLVFGDTQLYGKRKGMLYVQQTHGLFSQYIRKTGFQIRIRTKGKRMDRGNGLQREKALPEEFVIF